MKNNTVGTGEKEALLVTTAHKGVFFGYGVKNDAATIELADARMCVYWTADLHGVLGLAVKGPGSGCKISPAVNSIVLQDVTSVSSCTKEAVKNWEKGIWT